MRARHLNLVPLLCFGVVFGYACYSALVIGHWPYYSHPDPTDLPAGHLTTPIALAALIGLAFVVLLPIAYALYRSLAAWRKWPVSGQKETFVLYGIGAMPWLLDLLAAYASRYSLLSWILD